MKGFLSWVGHGLHLMDVKLIDFFDGWAAYIQRRGWVPLNTLKMVFECLFWGCLSYQSRDSKIIYFMIPAGGLAMWFSYIRWADAVGYWENVRKMQRLNAEVYTARVTAVNWRIAAVVAMGLGGVLNLCIAEYFECFTSILVIIVNYGSCCLFLGPGDFAKKREEKLSHLPQET